MRTSVKEAWQQLLVKRDISSVPTQISPDVLKEDLVILDPDLISDYTPVEAVQFYVPDWIKVRYLKLLII